MKADQMQAGTDRRLRRAQVMEWVGCTRHEIEKLVRCGTLIPIRVRANSRAYYSARQVAEVFCLELNARCPN